MAANVPLIKKLCTLQTRLTLNQHQTVMLVYGRKAKLLAAETYTGKCTNCGMLATVQISLVQKYLHVFWLPFVPIGKTGVSKCSNCKQVLKLKEMPVAYTDVYDVLKQQVKTPLYMYSGAVVLAIIISAAVYEDIQNGKKNTLLITAPQKGDVFEIKTEEGQYTLYKVDGIHGDTVFVRQNQYETDKESGLSGLKQKGDTAYTRETMELLKQTLKKMLDDGEIIDVDRQ